MELKLSIPSKVLMVLPGFLLVLYFCYFSIGWNALLSFTDWYGIAPSYNFVGLSNWSKMFHDPVFWKVFENTLILTGVFVPTTLGLGILLASSIDKVGGRLAKVSRTTYLIPYGLAFVVVGVVWCWMLNPLHGTFNSILRSIGLDFLAVNWLGNPHIVLWALIGVLIWKSAGLAMIILLGGIKSVPNSQINAARLEGASSFQIYTRIVIPQLGSSFFAAFVFLTMLGLKGTFALVWTMTQGGPGNASNVLPVFMYRKAFITGSFSYGATIATFLLLLSAAIILPQLYFIFSRGGEE